MANSNKNGEWIPNKKGDQYTDEEIRELSLYSEISILYSRLRSPESVILQMCRDYITELYNSGRDFALSDRLGEILDEFGVTGENRQKGLLIYEKDGINRFKIGVSHSTKRSYKTGRRFTKTCYEKFIGEKFTVHFSPRSKNLAAKGSYHLLIQKGDPKNKLSPNVRLILQQELDNKQKAPIIVFPPANPEAPVINSEIHEVTRISVMLKVSHMDMIYTPAMRFKLHKELEKREAFENASSTKSAKSASSAKSRSKQPVAVKAN